MGEPWRKIFAPILNMNVFAVSGLLLFLVLVVALNHFIFQNFYLLNKLCNLLSFLNLTKIDVLL